MKLMRMQRHRRSKATVAPAVVSSGSSNRPSRGSGSSSGSKNFNPSSSSEIMSTPYNTHHNMSQMILNGLKFNCLARWTLQQSMTANFHPKGAEQWNEILKEMEANTSVTDLYLGPYFYSSLTPEELDDFLARCAKQLSRLRVLSIGTLEFTKTQISGSTLGRSFLQGGAIHLQTLRVERDLMLSSPEEIADLAAGVANHPCLQRVSLSSLHPVAATGLVAKNCLDPLLEALATCRKLESLQLGLSSESHAWHSETGVASPAAVALLGTLPRLTWLVLSRLEIGDDHIVALCATLKGDEKDDDRQQYDPFHHRTPRAPLKIMDLTKTQVMTERAWDAVLDMLRTTQVHLEALDMPCSQTNPVAQSIKRDVHLYLKLNREGRRRKLREMTGNKREWLEMVARYYSNDLSLLATVVRESPWICLQNS